MNLFNTTYLRTLLKAKLKQLLNGIPFLKSKTYTTFLIVGHPRTGTSLLHTYLNSHWNVLSLNEPLNNLSNNKVLFKNPSRVIKTIGFKYFYEYTNDAFKKNILIELVKAGNVKIIKINRKNQLRTYVSRCIAEKTNEWSSTSEKQQSTAHKKITLSKESCLQAFAEYKRDELNTDKIFNEYKTSLLAIDYELLVAEPNKTMYAVQEFLNVTQQVPESLLLRQNAEPLNELIENYNDLKKSFEGTEFDIFFEEENC